MIDRVFFDTNIIVYLFDTSEPAKRKKIIKLVESLSTTSKLFISSQVLNEFINVVMNKIEKRLKAKEIVERIKFLEDIFNITPLSYPTSLHALNITDRYKYSFWDSLILSSAIENECNILITEDMQHGQIIEEQLKILNPFKKI